MKKLAFIGVGNMGGAILRAVSTRREGYTISASNRSFEKAERIAEECGIEAVRSNTECVRDADFVFLGVKPFQAAAVLREIAPCMKEDAVLVSIAAGVTGEMMRAALGRENPIVRLMPNTPCAIGCGLVLIAPCGDVPQAILDELAALLAPCGQVGFTDEGHADAASTVGGCTPAFTYLFIESLADGAVLTGIPREKAMLWAAQAVAGSAQMVLQGRGHPGALKDAVCSPGGSTIEGVRILNREGFRGEVMDAIVTAWEKAGTLGK